MAKIYAIVSEQLVLYVGKTVQSLTSREYRHRNKSRNSTGSRDIPDWIDWEIKLLEECADELCREREQHYYDTLKPLYNIVKPLNTDSHLDQVKQNQLKNKNELLSLRKEVKRLREILAIHKIFIDDNSAVGI